jgi:hypothetical protein
LPERDTDISQDHVVAKLINSFVGVLCECLK